MNISLLFLIILSSFSYNTPEDCAGKLLLPDGSAWSGNNELLTSGYWYDCYWIEGLVDTNSYSQTPVHFSTRALWQSRGLMNQSAAYNGVPTHDIIGGIALTYCGDVARQAHIRAPALGYSEWVITRVADCANPVHAPYHIIYLRSGLELDYELARRLDVLNWRSESGGIGPTIEVCLTNGNPYIECSGAPIDYSSWWMSVTRYR